MVIFLQEACKTQMLSKQLKSQHKVLRMIYDRDVNSINVTKKMLSLWDAALKILFCIIIAALNYSHLWCSVVELLAVRDGLLASAL